MPGHPAGSTRSTSWLGMRDSRRLLPKGAARTPSQADRRAGPRHAGEGQAAHPRPDPVRRPSGPAHVGPRATGHDQADHHRRGRSGHPRPHRRVWHLRPPARLGGYQHRTVCHARGEYARDADGDGFCEVHVNTMEGFWSLLRSWWRPHCGISQDKLPLYLGFFQFVHNARRRGKALLSALIAGLVV